MIAKNNTHNPGEPVERKLFLFLLSNALRANEIRFARQASLQWLSEFPGDLEVRKLNAETIAKVRGPEEALPLLEALSEIDPHWLALQEIIFEYRRILGMPTAGESGAAVLALGGALREEVNLPDWGIHLAKASKSWQATKIDEAEILIQRALMNDPPTPLIASMHLEVLQSSGQTSPRAVRSLAEHYRNRWPECAPINLYLANALMEGGESEQAVNLIHKVVAIDIAGQVPFRMWGPHHPYRSLWPDKIATQIDESIPAAVAAAMGWNQLTAGEPGPGAQLSEADKPEEPEFESTEMDEPVLETVDEPVVEPVVEPVIESPAPERFNWLHRFMFWKKTDPVPTEEIELEESLPIELAEPSPEPKVSAEFPPVTTHAADSAEEPAKVPEEREAVRSVQIELERVAHRLKKPYLAKADGRFPVYVLFSTRQGLVNKYGEANADAIAFEMGRLEQTIKAKNGWDALVLFGDDPRSTTPFGIKPEKYQDPGALKLVLTDLDKALKKRGEMIGALLIVGGPEVVPFHHLPNPVDDEDIDVPSDNPYATRDENYFIPEWLVGRLPGGAGRDPQVILDNLSQIRDYHIEKGKPKKWYEKMFDTLINWLWFYQGPTRPSFGYTAAAWRKASLSVFRPIGDTRAMLASPPTLADHLPWNGLTPARLGYYNLHGLIDASEWFGQRDPGQAFDGPDYPIALRPSDVVNSGRSPQLVFSEACFGAHIINKRIEEAMALKFLYSGTLAVIGCTCTAYGSIATPLIAADLLGHAFWQYLQDGYYVGEALRLAKIHLAEEMHRRQGYLDGEDQKTLISFVLYGDPLAQTNLGKRVKKSVLRPQALPPEVKTVCDRAPKSPVNAPEEVLEHVKQVVAQYLPGMTGANLVFSQEHFECDGSNHECPNISHEEKSANGSKPNRRVVTLSKQVERDNLLHPRYARLTLDRQGKVVKLAVSR